MKNLSFWLICVTSFAAMADFRPFAISDISVMQVRADGQYDVICSNGNHEVVTDLDLHTGNVCPNLRSTTITGIASLQKRPDGQFNVICRDGSSAVASADDILQGKVCVVSIKQVDYVWVIGGMTENQTAMMQGASDFMAKLITTPGLDWQMGMIGTDIATPPVLGFASPFNNNTPNASMVFTTAMQNAILGNDNEQIFDPLAAVLTANPTFLRSAADLVIIMTNDAPDSSHTNTTAQQMVDLLTKLKGDPAKVRVYGIFGATDLGCSSGLIDGQWNFAGSVFDQLISATHGTNYSICQGTFSSSLLKIHDDVVLYVSAH